MFFPSIQSSCRTIFRQTLSYFMPKSFNNSIKFRTVLRTMKHKTNGHVKTFVPQKDFFILNDHSCYYLPFFFFIFREPLAPSILSVCFLWFFSRTLLSLFFLLVTSSVIFFRFREPFLGSSVFPPCPPGSRNRRIR